MLTAKIPIVLHIILFILLSISTSNQRSIPQPRSAQSSYELIYKTDATTELTGSITMLCRSFTTAENIPISEVQFWLNYTTCNNISSLREREDVNVLEVDSYSIKFNLTRSLEGYYTCGKNCIISTERELICKYNTISYSYHSQWYPNIYEHCYVFMCMHITY